MTFAETPTTTRAGGDQNNLMRRINTILRKNRKLMESHFKPGEEMAKCPRLTLAQEGFDFKFHTHTYLNKKGQTYFFCYDLGYLVLEHDWLLIVRRENG